MRNFILTVAALMSLSWTLSAQQLRSTVEAEVLAHGAAIRQAFADSDTSMIRRLHHAEVEKAFAQDNYLVGVDAVVANVAGTLAAYELSFTENEVEDLRVDQQTAVEQTRFVITGIPRGTEGEGFVFRGRTVVTYVRSGESPTGWVTWREVLQPW